MMDADTVGMERRERKRRSVAEKLAIVQLTLQPGGSVAKVARAHEVNANQVFKWRRLFEKGQLNETGAGSTALLPVTISADTESSATVIDEQSCSAGAIHIEFPGRAMISIESGADPALLRCVLESLRK